jgi:Holliday junction DNA helicase RuvA
MIAKLTGLRDALDENSVAVDVGGVGYLVFCSSRTLATLAPAGEMVSLLIETHVREDHIHLYGFNAPDERDWFRLLLEVQGVGARVALQILSALSPADLTGAIAAQDAEPLTVASGVGPKLARRIVGELKDKVPHFAETVAGPAAGVLTGRPGDAVSALVHLGYRRTEALVAVAQAQQALGHDAAVEDLIRGGLKELGR